MLPASIDKTDKRISPDLILSLHVLHQTLAHNNTSVIQHLLFYHKFVLENAEIQLNNNEHSFKRKKHAFSTLKYSLPVWLLRLSFSQALITLSKGYSPLTTVQY